MTEAKFLQGSTMRHVVVMSLTTSVGLMSIFFVDFIDMWFISLLGDESLTSAVGYAGTILFFNISLCIGLAIAMGALVSQSIGSRNVEQARKFSVHVTWTVFGGTTLFVLCTWPLLPWFVSLLGAKGDAADAAVRYLNILYLSTPFLGVGMSSGAALRAVGDANRAMYSTIAGGVVNAILDPIFIFVLDYGIEGAAAASFCARVAMFLFAFVPMIQVHQLWTHFDKAAFIQSLRPIFFVATPAMITNLATPISVAYITQQMSQFGDSAMTGLSIVNRLAPLAFAVVYATSGAVGPIIGQNYGAQDWMRVQSSVSNAFTFVGGYVLAVCLILWQAQEWLVSMFQAEGDAATLILFFCQYVAMTYAMAGATFVGNAAFNNLGKPHFSTILNFSKATIGTMPFVYWGAQSFQAPGVLMGMAIGNVLFGILSIMSIYWLIRQIRTC